MKAFDRAGESFDEMLAVRYSRRRFVGRSAGLTWGAFFGGSASWALASDRLLGFQSVPMSVRDAVVVPEGYHWTVVNAWGDPIVPGGPAFRPDATQSAADQAMQSGMHHDGMAFYPLPRGSNSSTRGLLVVNFEYTDDGLLHSDGMENWSAEKVRKSMNAHGMGVMEIEFDDDRWRVVADSSYGRRITADTPMRFTGPAAGHEWLRTEFDPTGTVVRGTWNNCAHGLTPWGTFLSCEENVTPYFLAPSGRVSRLLDRYGVNGQGWGYRWHEHEPRFNADRHPNEPNRHGWVVEINPFDPADPPVKHTALGRMAHENAALAIARDGRVVYYMGDDDFRSKFEHIYKYVSARPHVPGGDAAANRHVLEEGTLYAAKFESDGRGRWIELVHGKHGLTAEAGFSCQAEVLIDARTAADVVGATYMDRPEWIAVHPVSGEVFCTLSNNTSRGTGGPFGSGTPLGPDAANRRGPNLMGHIIRWREEGGDASGTRFEWDIFVEAGDPTHKEAIKRGTSGVAFAQPDGLFIDPRGVLWIQTDSSAKLMATRDWDRIGNNQMLAADPATGEIRRFLTGPVGSEITGMAMTPDMKSLFVNIQHPGEPPAEHPPRNDPKMPKAVSNWPDGPSGGRPRSATIAIRKLDGGLIGS